MSAIQLKKFRAIIIFVLSIVVLAPLRANGQASVLMHHNDVARTGQNLSETLLTPANVNAATFGKLFIQKVDGSIVGQPLYVPNVQLSNGTVHNMVFVATQHDSVFAFDADNNQGANAAPLWTVNYPKSVPNNADNFGCGTPGYTEIGIMEHRSSIPPRIRFIWFRKRSKRGRISFACMLWISLLGRRNLAVQ